MSKEFLESKRLFLKPLSFQELQYINHDELDKFEIQLELGSISDSVKLAISKKLIKMQNIHENFHKWYTYWMIINKENQKGIGLIGFKGVPDLNGYLEVGYSISSNYRKKRFMTEALETLINWTYRHEDAKGITAKVLKTNVGSVKVMNNCNFKLVGSTTDKYNYLIRFR